MQDNPENNQNELPINQPPAAPVSADEVPVNAEVPPAAEEQTEVPLDEVIVDTTVYRANAKVDPKHTIREPLPEGRPLPDPDNSICLLYTTPQQADEDISALKEKPTNDPAGMLDWFKAIQHADNFSQIVDDDKKAGFAAWRDKTEWRQYLEYQGHHLRVGKPRMGDAFTGQTLSGEAALLRVTERMSMGTHVQIPLYNSGIWVTIKPPLDDEFLELQERLALEKIELGRATRGLVFDNYQVYTLHHVLNFVYRHITGTTLKYGQEGLEAALDEAILVTDIPNLLLGVLCTMYPHGYELTQPCTADITKCTELFRGLISLPKISWVDTTRFNEEQRRHMSNRKSESMTLEEVRKYQSMFPAHESSVVQLPGDIKIILEVPTVGRYRDTGIRWVDAIDRDAAAAFGTSLQGKAREDYMLRQAIISSLQAYSHWYKHVVIASEDGEGDDQMIVDRLTLESLAKTWSSSVSIADTVEQAIKVFNDYASCTIVGIVNFECPKCKKTQLRPDAPNQVIIPIDVVSTFFTLLSRRLTGLLM